MDNPSGNPTSHIINGPISDPLNEPEFTKYVPAYKPEFLKDIASYVSENGKAMLNGLSLFISHLHLRGIRNPIIISNGVMLDDNTAIFTATSPDTETVIRFNVETLSVSIVTSQGAYYVGMDNWVQCAATMGTAIEIFL